MMNVFKSVRLMTTPTLTLIPGTSPHPTAGDMTGGLSRFAPGQTHSDPTRARAHITTTETLRAPQWQINKANLRNEIQRKLTTALFLFLTGFALPLTLLVFTAG